MGEPGTAAPGPDLRAVLSSLAPAPDGRSFPLEDNRGQLQELNTLGREIPTRGRGFVPREVPPSSFRPLTVAEALFLSLPSLIDLGVMVDITPQRHCLLYATPAYDDRRSEPFGPRTRGAEAEEQAVLDLYDALNLFQSNVLQRVLGEEMRCQLVYQRVLGMGPVDKAGPRSLSIPPGAMGVVWLKADRLEVAQPKLSLVSLPSEEEGEPAREYAEVEALAFDFAIPFITAAFWGLQTRCTYSAREVLDLVAKHQTRRT